MYFILKMGNYQCAAHCQTCLCQNLSTWDGEDCTLLHPHEQPNIIMFVGLLLLDVPLLLFFLINTDYLHPKLYNEIFAIIMIFLAFIGFGLFFITYMVLYFLDYDCTTESGLTSEWASNANLYLMIVLICYIIFGGLLLLIEYCRSADWFWTKLRESARSSSNV